MKLLNRILLSLAVMQSVHADCDFIITNYTSYPLTAKVGFFLGLHKSIESIVKIKPNSTTATRVKSDYSCNDSNSLGMGLAYLRFPNDPNGAGANYSPEKGVISLMGKATGEKSGRPIVADNGMPAWLSVADSRAIDNKTFEMEVNYVGRPNTFSAGTN